MFLNLIEFYSTPSGAIMYTQEGSNEANQLKPGDIDLVNEILKKIARIYPQAYNRLQDIHQSSKRNLIYYRYLMVKRFIACNMGNFDTHKYDIGEEGDFQLEEVKCPIRSLCTHEGIICKPVPVHLSPRDKQILKYLVYGYSTQNVADLLKIAYVTVENHKRRIYKKLNCNKVTEAAFYYHEHLKK